MTRAAPRRTNSSADPEVGRPIRSRAPHRTTGGAKMTRQFELVERVRAYDPNANEDALNRAYVYSMQAHGSQTRASGDP